MSYKKLLTAACSAGVAFSLAVVPAAADAGQGSLLTITTAVEEKIISAVTSSVQENQNDIQNYAVLAEQAKKVFAAKKAVKRAVFQRGMFSRLTLCI